MTEENDKKKNEYNNTNETLLNWYRKTNKWTIKITQIKGPRTILVPCEKVLGHDWYTIKLEIFIIDE